jgi:hypothetical protein
MHLPPDTSKCNSSWALPDKPQKLQERPPDKSSNAPVERNTYDPSDKHTELDNEPCESEPQLVL